VNATELKATLNELGIGPTAFAQLIGVTPRAVSLWLAGEREVPGPAAAYLSLFASLPKALQAKELSRLTQERADMYEGMYGVELQGLHGQGLAAIVLLNGRVFGCDNGGVRYDGTYQPSQQAGLIDAKVRVEIPAGTVLVQTGRALPMNYGFDLELCFRAQGITLVQVQTPLGGTPVNARISYMRPLPQ
jgi:hypothetical protein